MSAESDEIAEGNAIKEETRMSSGKNNAQTLARYGWCWRHVPEVGEAMAKIHDGGYSEDPRQCLDLFRLLIEQWDFRNLIKELCSEPHCIHFKYFGARPRELFSTATWNTPPRISPEHFESPFYVVQLRPNNSTIEMRAGSHLQAFDSAKADIRWRTIPPSQGARCVPVYLPFSYGGIVIHDAHTVFSSFSGIAATFYIVSKSILDQIPRPSRLEFPIDPTIEERIKTIEAYGVTIDLFEPSKE